jgi:hypothetical protein
VIWLEPKRLAKDTVAVALAKTAVRHEHRVPDTAYYTYKKCGNSETHSNVIKAYKQQALRLASLVLHEVAVLFA